MHVFGLVCRESPVRLWGLDSRERMRRTLLKVGVTAVVEHAEEIDPGASAIVIRADHVYDEPLLKSLIACPETALRRAEDGDHTIVAVHTSAAGAAAAQHALEGNRAITSPSRIETPQSIIREAPLKLRKAQLPFVFEITPESRASLERLLYDTSYKGVTDLVTKFVWPRPAFFGVRQCVRWGLTPNVVTGTGFVLMLLALVAFWKGELWWGLLAGWTMTWLDTVDGKLARTTLTSSTFGHYFDHGMDIVHPPFWYLAWGYGLGAGAFPVGGVGFDEVMVLIFGGYVAGRLVEGFSSRILVRGGLFVWKPYDSWFRLVTARRNPCLILLTLGLLVGRPDLGLLWVALWTAVSSLLLGGRMLMAMRARLSAGRMLRSWLVDVDPRRDAGRLPVRVFAQRPPELSHAAPALAAGGEEMASGAST